ncbi:MAG: Mrp/NBP35 family ATP-binding protein [Acidimicrobiales bacterium]
MSDQPDLVERVTEALRGVVDPELGDDIVSLGMLRGVHVGKEEARSGARVTVDLALTVAACPLRGQLREDVERACRLVPGIASVEVAIGVMTPEDRSALMSRARLSAQERDALVTDLPPTARVLAIASGKGGVGKSSITVNLAVALARRGLCVGILDADVWGHSVPRLLGVEGEIEAKDKKMVPLERHLSAEDGGGTVQVISMGYLADEDTAIMWRGLVLNRAVQHFLEDVRWGDLDYLLVDLPPGTGDIQMGLARMLPRTEVIVVTTPPLAAQKVAGRAADMARKGHLRVAGVIENMSPFVCEHGEEHALFGRGGGKRLAEEVGVPLIGEVPLHEDVANAGDAGAPVALGDGPLATVFREIAGRIITEIAPPVEMAGCTARMMERVEQALG